MIKLDYSLDSPEERNQLVEKILAENPDVTPKYMEVLADYLIMCMEKQERKQKKILTDNRMCTVNKRETSYEGLASQLENGEDGIYNLMNENKNQIFQPKISITKKDLEDIPELRQLKETIDIWDEKIKTITGKDRYTIKKTLIDLRKEQYIIKDAYRRPIVPKSVINTKFEHEIPVEITLNEDGYSTSSTGAALTNWQVCSFILCNYSKLRADSDGKMHGDLHYLLDSFDEVATIALKEHPLYEKLITYKIDGRTNNQVSDMLHLEFGIKHTPEYISSLWRNKIPKMIANAAEDQWLYWYYLNEEKGVYKKCTRCGQIKLALNKYYSRNVTSKDGCYSICKSCRNAKAKQQYALAHGKKN